MAFKMKGFSAFTKMDSPKKANEIKSFIKNSMDKMSDKELMSKVHDMTDGKTEYTWNPKTGEVNSYNKTKDGKSFDYLRKKSSSFKKAIAKEKTFTELQDDPKKPVPKVPTKSDRWNEANEEEKDILMKMDKVEKAMENLDPNSKKYKDLMDQLRTLDNQIWQYD